MNTENRGRTKHDVLTAVIWATLLLLLLFGAKIEAAVAQDASPGIRELTLTGVVDLALKKNLDIQIANIDVASKQQERVGARSALLPKAGFDADDAVTRYNTMVVLGVQPAISPHGVGPFQAVHIGPTFLAPIFDLTLMGQYQASGHHLLASRADEQTVREETVLLAVTEYMAHLRALASITAAQSRIVLADWLAHQAQDLFTDGVASKIDVSRAQVRLRQEQQHLVDDQRDAETTLDALKRILNMPDSEQIEFADQQDVFSTPSLEFSDPLSSAFQQPPKLQFFSENAKTADLAHKAVEAESLPKLNSKGNWNEQGQTFNTMTPGYDYRVNVRFPIFTSGRLGAERKSPALLSEFLLAVFWQCSTLLLRTPRFATLQERWQPALMRSHGYRLHIWLLRLS